MSKRTEALWRIVALIWAWTVGWILLSIVSLVASILGTIDIILQLILGSDAISRNGFTFSAIASAFQWMADLNVFAFTGRGEFAWFPQV